ncbi:hypothetical protein ACLOAV_008922 [Pseudogymnoascus australis]
MKLEPQAPNGDWQYANTIIAIVVHVGIMISSSIAFIRRWFPRTRVADIFTPPAVIEEGAAVVAERAAAVAERVAAEGERGAAAGERGAAEGERGAAGGERKTAEGERKRAEAERERAEAERERAAAEREEAQAARLSLETHRMAAQVYQGMKEEFWKAHATTQQDILAQQKHTNALLLHLLHIDIGTSSGIYGYAGYTGRNVELQGSLVCRPRYPQAPLGLVIILVYVP